MNDNKKEIKKKECKEKGGEKERMTTKKERKQRMTTKRKKQKQKQKKECQGMEIRGQKRRNKFGQTKPQMRPSSLVTPYPARPQRDASKNHILFE